MADAIRYVQLYDSGEGDYTRERHEWLGNATHEDVANWMAKAERQRSARRRK
jgi:hypothetical protein